MRHLFDILYEDEELLVLNKPAGLVCHPTKTDEYSSLISRVRLHLGRDSKPHLVNRLDRETSGVMLVAKTNEAARDLRQLMEGRAVHKEYLAIVHGTVPEDHGVIDAPLGKDIRSRVAVKDCVRPDGNPSRTEFRVLERKSVRGGLSNVWGEVSGGGGEAPGVPAIPISVLRVLPHTGRKHQIRIHLAHLGHPIVGDKLYGGDEDAYLALVEDRLTAEQRARLILDYQALHAEMLRFLWRGAEREFRCPPEPWLARFRNPGIAAGPAGAEFLPPAG